MRISERQSKIEMSVEVELDTKVGVEVKVEGVA